MLLLPALLLTLAATQAPAAQAPPEQNPIDVLGRRRTYGPPFISPMGEPFRRHAANDDPIADWFAQADLNHDGYLTVDEMVADGNRFFEILDANRDGRIDAEEIDYYERIIAPEVHGESYALRGDPMPTVSDTDVPENSGQYATRVTSGGGHNRALDGAGGYGLIDNPEPVTSADTNFNGSVSLQEFQAAAKRRFSLLDQAQKGRLALSQLER